MPNEAMPELVERVVRRLPDRKTPDIDWEVVYRDAHSNDVAEVHFADDRILHVKRARGPDSRDRIDVSRKASRLLRERAGLRAPVHLDLQPPLEEPVVAYWRLYEPTLSLVAADWPTGDADDGALRSLGDMIRRMQAIGFAGHGPLLSPDRTLAEFLEEDVGQRLAPAVYAHWPDGPEPLERFLYVISRWVRGWESPAVFAHNDLHAENVLCRSQDGSHLCIGVLDLEDAFAAPPEADLAKMEVLHGPLFGRPWPRRWFDAVFEGYGRHGAEMHAFRLALMRIYHLLNLGFYAALVGIEDRARHVAAATRRELDALGEPCRHADLVEDLVS